MQSSPLPLSGLLRAAAGSSDLLEQGQRWSGRGAQRLRGAGKESGVCSERSCRGPLAGGLPWKALCDEHRVRPGNHPAREGCVRGEVSRVVLLMWCVLFRGLVCSGFSCVEPKLTRFDAARAAQVGFIAHLKNLQSHTIVEQVRREGPLAG